MADTAITERTPIIQRRVEWNLLPIKLHFILLYGAAAGVVPFLPVLAKQLGLSATAVGAVYTAQPIMLLFAKPLFGAVVDHTRNLKMVMITLVIVEGACLAGILFIPPIEHVPSYEGITLTCLNRTSSVSISHRYNVSCIDFHSSKNITCEFQLVSCSNFDVTGTNSTCNKTCGISPNERVHIQVKDDHMILDSFLANKINILTPPKEETQQDIIVYNEQSNGLTYDYHFLLGADSQDDTDNFSKESYSVVNSHSTCNCGDSTWDAISCNVNLDSCLSDDEIERSIYKTYQFWTFAVLLIISLSCSGTLFTLSDAACCELLRDRIGLYGNQRLFATLSWGIVSLLVGYLNDAVKIGKSNSSYEPGFYIMFLMLSLDIILLFKMRLKKASFTPTICKDIGKLFASVEILTFTSAVFIVGVITGLVWNYELWFLQNLGAGQFLMGLTLFLQCIIAEVPFFYMSDFMIRTFGHFFCLVGTFTAFCLRCVLYYNLMNPWLILPVDLLHGQTYANFYANMISFGKIKAPPGAEATMLGLLGGAFEGLGVGLGSLLGGLGFDSLGDRLTFLTAGLLSAVWAVVFLIIALALEQCKRRRQRLLRTEEKGFKVSQTEQ